ncbi:hypothetical protein QR680_011915 [Steinernema hermaphroditum]|uniref:Integrase catalytic domain-containing protein n=1 Tax=Steinernema hermaphroditum TaxID=289476 RepID=A0AA39I212_9BILA|nr:hypothetical protein QR680_011915 [Steinernema hermaphroditum]
MCITLRLNEVSLHVAEARRIIEEIQEDMVLWEALTPTDRDVTVQSIHREVEEVDEKLNDSLVKLQEDFRKLSETQQIAVEKSYETSGTAGQETLDELRQAKRKILRKYRIIIEKAKLSIVSITQAVQPIQTHSSLPKMTLPEFAGNSWEWRAFKNMFMELVDSQPISKLQKFSYLRNALKGDALRSVARFAVAEENYDMVWERLQQQYGDSQKVINDLTQKLNNIQRRSDTWDAQRQLLNDIWAIYEQLKAYEIQVDNEFTWTQILHKFPYETQMTFMTTHHITKSAQVSTLIEKLDQFITWELEKNAVARRDEKPSNPRMNAGRKDRDSFHKGRKDFRHYGTKNEYGGAQSYKARFGETQEVDHSRNEAPAKISEETPSPFVINACRICDKPGHSSLHCLTYKDVAERKNAVMRKSACFNCLRKGHSVAECRSPKCTRCGKAHHISLCLAKNANSAHEGFSKFVETTQLCAPSAEAVDAKMKRGEKSYILAGSAMVIDKNTHVCNKLTVILDSASSESFITVDAARKLNLPTVDLRSFSARGFAQEEVIKKNAVPVKQIDVTAPNGSRTQIKALEIKQIVKGTIERPKLSKEDRETLKNLGLQLSESSKELRKGRKPDLLIGADYLGQFLKGTPRALPSGLFVFPTTLGAMISGKEDAPDASPNDSIVCLQMSDAPTQELKFDIVQQAEKEAVETMISEWTKNDTLAEFGGTAKEEKQITNKKVADEFHASVELREDGYYVKFPWKQEIAELPSNWAIAYKRLKQTLERADEQILKGYQDTFSEQLNRKMIEEVDPDAPTGQVVHYLAHQPVVTPQKETTKVRIVFDASAHFRGSMSLNDAINQGPTILPLIVGINLRFRTGSIALVGDVEKAFLQVKLLESERDAVRFLWVKNTNLPPTGRNLVIYRYRCVPFGINASPFLLGATIAHHLSQCEDQTLAKKIVENTYVDNLILTCNTVDEAADLYAKSKREFSALRMNLREFMSNDNLVLEKIAFEDRSENAQPKILGTQWNSTTDELKLEVLVKPAKKATKRTVAQQAASIYDPMGLLIPLLHPAKRFQQELWLTNDWDEELNAEQKCEWQRIAGDIQGFKKCIPRRVANVEDTVDIVIFCDANKNTMACCAYAVCGKNSHLIMAKNRLKPLKTTVTVPRLELNAYVLGAELGTQLVQELKTQIRIASLVLLTDSQIALAWVQSPKTPVDAGIYVERRRSNFRKKCIDLEKDVEKVLVGYVNTLDNPADCATRGLEKHEFEDHLWWTGPRFLTKPHAEWPERCQPEKLSEEENAETVCLLTQTQNSRMTAVIPWKRTNSLRRLARIVAYVLRFIRIRMDKVSDQTRQKYARLGLEIRHADYSEPLRAEEITLSREMIIRCHQREAEEQGRWKEQKHLRPFLDSSQLWRCAGRLKNSSLSDSAKTPILIDSRSKLAEMIVQETHETINASAPLHLSARSTIATVRQTFWIPAIRRIVRSQMSKCWECKRFNNAPLQYPDMPDLPSRRVKSAEPFEHCGLDYFGPLKYRNLEDVTVRKSYGCIITCTVTRMVHLELVADATAKSFINALRNFMARRRVPRTITCDNAPTFALGEQVIAAAFRDLEDTSEFVSFTADQEIRWLRITAYSPWKGAFYERLIQDIKRCLYKCMKRRIWPFEDLRTTLTQIEAIMNSRPLTYLDSEPGEWAILRPIDFVHRRARLSLPSTQTSEDVNDSTYFSEEELRALNSRKEALDALEESDKHTHKAWESFQRDYLISLREKHRRSLAQGRTQKIKPREGMIVMLEGDPLPKHCWKLARIEKLLPSSDGQIREVELFLPDSRTIKRSINHLIPMELSEEEDEASSSAQNLDHQPSEANVTAQNANSNVQDSTGEDDEDIPAQTVPAKVSKRTTRIVPSNRTTPYNLRPRNRRQ